MVYSIPLAIFIDDISGNKSKQWSKHFSCYMSDGALPRTKLDNEFHVRFVAPSPFALPLEIMQSVRGSIDIARPYGLLFVGDNPVQAELCSCTGLTTNSFCRTCQAGGTREWKQSNEGFPERNIATTLTEAVRWSGVKDVFAQPIIDILVKMGQDLQKTNVEGSSYRIDMHKDTPTEILHTILLGVVKYDWGQTVWVLEKGKDFPLFQMCLNSILSDGLKIPKVQADCMCQYKGGLIRKHCKTLSQIMAFAVEGLVPPDVLEAFLLWCTTSEDVTSYTCALTIFICKCSLSILISKPKFHFLLHLPFFIRCFGSAVLLSTEHYEAYNAVFRACSIIAIA
ncbi:hypothetical protein DFH09DRAFT_1251771 [Mycena vulgaris]|nr:hypothetical protein DFH09DRAFT_1251771 [Mycena vulgaris]